MDNEIATVNGQTTVNEEVLMSFISNTAKNTVSLLQTEVDKLNKPVAKIQVQCFGNVPKRGTAIAAGWDVNPISVKMIAHNGWTVECRTNAEVTEACQTLKKMDKRSLWKRFKDWWNDEQPNKGWKQLWFNTGLRCAPEDATIYISVEPCSRTVKTDYQLHNSLGTVDNDYRGDIYAIYSANWTTYDDFSIIRLLNTCCQLKAKKTIEMEFIETDELTKTARGSGGFGSTEKIKN